MHFRAERDDYYKEIIDHIIEKMWQVRAVTEEQYIEASNQLCQAQKVWLCDHNKTLREKTDDWLNDIVSSITNFLFNGHEKILNKKAIKLGNIEHKHIRKLVLINKEALR